MGCRYSPRVRAESAIGAPSSSRFRSGTKTATRFWSSGLRHANCAGSPGTGPLMRFKNLIPRLQALIIIQCLAAAVTAYASWRAFQPQDAWMLAFLVLCGIIGGACKVDVNVPLGRLSLAFTVTYFSLIILGTSEALLVGFLGTLAGVICNFKETHRRLLP